MSTALWMSLTRRLSLLSAVGLLTVGSAIAQSSSNLSASTMPSASDSSSQAIQLVSDDMGGGMAMKALPIAGGAGAGAGQYGHDKHTAFSMNHIALELGAGFNAPIGNDTPYITWGGNFTAGAGLNFSKRLALLGEFQFLDNKLPGALVAAGGGQTGNSHIIALTVDPMIDLFPKRVNSAYITGGGGYYHKSTNFTIQECCDFYGYPVNVTANSFTSNQAGVNLGVGISHRLGGVYGDGKMKVFGEARYTYIHTPPITATDGLGTTELIPVTIGFRW